MTNVNPETGVHYGIISARNLDPEVICDLQVMGRDVHWEERKQEITDQTRRDWENGNITGEDYEDELEYRLERAGDEFYDDEPVHEFQRDGVRGRTTWLGGGMLVWIFKSDWVGKFDLCSPCVPGAANCDSPNPNGVEGYDVNPEWKLK